MKIKKSGLGKNVEQNKNSSGNFISEVIDRVFSICLEDKKFNSKEKFKLIEQKTIDLSERISKQDKLLNESKRIKSSISKKLSDLDEEITLKKEKILESLGSEL